MRRSNATTLRDVAREAGVTAMAASVVLNGARSSTRVSGETRARIMEAADRLSYRPNAVARGLAKRRMDTLGVVAAIEGGEMNFYIIEVLNGILEASAQHGQNTTVFSVADWKKDSRRIHSLCDGRIDGMILIGPLIDSGFARGLPAHTPFISLHSDALIASMPNLDTDNEGGAFLAVKHLIDWGHRRILHLAGTENLGGACKRIRGYRRALEEAGIKFREDLVIPGGYGGESGSTRIEHLIETMPLEKWPTAIFCANDAIAYACIETLTEHGVRVPHDLSIVGFDDSLAARMTVPPLTTVRQPFREMGRRAVERLVELIQHEFAPNHPLPVHETGTPHDEVFGVELIVRKSVGKPRDRKISLTMKSKP